MNSARVYYAHSMQIYNTERECRELAFLKGIHPNLICPNNDLGKIDKGMAGYLKIASWADKVICSEYKNHIGSGVFSEIELALKKNIPVYCLKKVKRKYKLLLVKGVYIIDIFDPKINYAKVQLA